MVICATKGTTSVWTVGIAPSKPDGAAPSPVPKLLLGQMLWLRWGCYPIGTWNQTHLSPITWWQDLLQINLYSYPLKNTVASGRLQTSQKCPQSSAISVLLPTKLSIVSTWQQEIVIFWETHAASELEQMLCSLCSYAPGLGSCFLFELLGG